MKLKKIVAAVLGTAVALSAAMPLVACNKNSGAPSSLGSASNFDIDDYIDELDVYGELSSSRKGITSATKLNADDETRVSRYGEIMVFRGNNGFRVYNTAAERFIAENLSTQPDPSYVGNIPALRLNDGDKTAYLAYDGTTLLPMDEYYDTTAETNYYYVGGDTVKTKIHVVNGIKRSGGGMTTNYFKVETDENTGVTHYVPVDKTALSEFPSGKYEEGAYVSSRAQIYSSEYPVEGEISKYEYAIFNNTYKFYKDDAETGKVNVGYGDVLGFVGNYMYYKTERPVAPDCASYNYVKYENDIAKKYVYKLYRYDIVSASLSELSYNVKLEELIPVYNKNAKTYDAAMISCYETSDGVFVEPDDERYIKPYMTDANLNIAIDFTDKIGFPSYKLSDDRYLAVGFDSNSYMMITDADGNYVTDVARDSLYAEEKLIKFYANGKYGLKDYDGKIAVAPKYDSIGKFFGGYAHASVTENGKTKSVLLDKTGATRDVPQNDPDNEVYVSFSENGWYKVIKKSKDFNVNPYTAEFFDYASTTIKRFSDLNYYAALDLTILNNILTVGSDYYFVK